MDTTLSAFLSTATPHLLEIFGAALTLIIAWATDTMRRRWGLDIEARHREALHSALMTGARIAAERGLRGTKATDLAVSYARDSVPAALNYLSPADAVLEQLARSKFHIVVPA